ncbi:MAG: hypothetical protein ACR2QH_00415 [Geminicoccaceae bacterium]
MNDKLAPPAKSEHEALAAVFWASVQLAPGGSSIKELVDFHSPYRERVDRFFRIVSETIRDHDAFIRKWQSDDFLQSIVIDVKDEILRTTDHEKLQILRNVLVNAYNGFELNEYKRTKFMSLVRRYSPDHIKCLHLIAEHDKARRSAGLQDNQLENFVHVIRQHLEIEDDFLLQIQADLVNDRLIVGKANQTHYPPSTSTKMTSVSEAFIRFIKVPSLPK